MKKAKKGVNPSTCRSWPEPNQIDINLPSEKTDTPRTIQFSTQGNVVGGRLGHARKRERNTGMAR